MFPYYGSKRTLARTYQTPTHSTIVEPFAGAAGYACYWLDIDPTKRAVLYDSNPHVVETWHRLLAMEPDEILAIPGPVKGERTVEFLHMGIVGATALRHYPNSRAVTGFMVTQWPALIRRIAADRAHIGDRIEVHHADYREVPNLEATYFVDPPYQTQGYLYQHDSNRLDYDELGRWCKARAGQVIVCEAEPAAWLPFEPHRRLNTIANAWTTELVWNSTPDLRLFDFTPATDTTPLEEELTP